MNGNGKFNFHVFCYSFAVDTREVFVRHFTLFGIVPKAFELRKHRRKGQDKDRSIYKPFLIENGLEAQSFNLLIVSKMNHC